MIIAASRSRFACRAEDGNGCRPALAEVARLDARSAFIAQPDRFGALGKGALLGRFDEGKAAIALAQEVGRSGPVGVTGFGAGKKDEAWLSETSATGDRMRATGLARRVDERRTREHRAKRRHDHRINADSDQYRCRGGARKRAFGAVGIVPLPGQETAGDRGGEERPGRQDEVAVNHDRARNRGEAEENRGKEPPNTHAFEPAWLRQLFRFDRSSDEDGDGRTER